MHNIVINRIEDDEEDSEDEDKDDGNVAAVKPTDALSKTLNLDDNIYAIEENTECRNSR